MEISNWSAYPDSGLFYLLHRHSHSQNTLGGRTTIFPGGQVTAARPSVRWWNVCQESGPFGPWELPQHMGKWLFMPHYSASTRGENVEKRQIEAYIAILGWGGGGCRIATLSASGPHWLQLWSLSHKSVQGESLHSTGLQGTELQHWHV